MCSGTFEHTNARTHTGRTRPGSKSVGNRDIGVCFAKTRQKKQHTFSTTAPSIPSAFDPNTKKFYKKICTQWKTQRFTGVSTHASSLGKFEMEKQLSSWFIVLCREIIPTKPITTHHNPSIPINKSSNCIFSCINVEMCHCYTITVWWNFILCN